MDLIDNSEYYFDYVYEPDELKKLNKKIKKDGDMITQGFVPTKLEFEQFIICLKHRITNEIASFIHFSIRYNFHDIKKILYVIYSYTFINERKKGLNKMLRLVLENACKLNECDAVVSMPFKESESRIVLNKLGYQNVYSDIFVKYIK